MNKKDYQRPTTKVVQLKHQCHILAGSQLAGQLEDPDDYELQDDPFNF